MRKHLFLAFVRSLREDPGEGMRLTHSVFRTSKLEDCIRAATTFSLGRMDAIPDEFSEFSLEMEARDLMHLPFPSVVFEYDPPPPHREPVSVLCAPVLLPELGPTTPATPATLVLPVYHLRDGGCDVPGVFFHAPGYYRDSSWLLAFPCGPQDGTEEEKAGLRKSAAFASAAVFLALAVLASRDTRTDHVEAPRRLNAKRARLGREPLWDYRVVKVGPRKPAVDRPATGGSHASPRLHWRRGHFRTWTYKGDGRTEEIPVAPSLVGSSEFGGRVKDYAVTVGASPPLPAGGSAT